MSLNLADGGHREMWYYWNGRAEAAHLFAENVKAMAINNFMLGNDKVAVAFREMAEDFTKAEKEALERRNDYDQSRS